MLAAGASAFSGFLVICYLTVIAAAIGLGVALWAGDPKAFLRRTRTRERGRTFQLVEREKDLAAALGFRANVWISVRVGMLVAGVLVAIWSGIWLLYLVMPVVAWAGVGFAVSGRASSRRLRRERAFIGQLRNLRDRMAISNQSLDTALQELGRRPGAELGYVLAPLARGGSVVANIVDVGLRSRSPVIEYSCGLLLWSRTRSLDTLIESIDEVLLPISQSQLEIQEEAQVTLAQQRAVTYAMTGLMGFVFLFVIRVGIFASFYKTAGGSVVLAIVFAIFFFLVWMLGKIVSTETWTRWDLRRLAAEQERLNA